MNDWLNKTHVGDCRKLMRQMIADGVKVQTICTSPPYWGLRDYDVDGAIGLEPSLSEWLEQIVEVFHLARDILADDGTLWLNLGDAYANDGKWGGETGGKQAYLDDANRKRVGRSKRITGLKPKDLMGQPWRVAFALQDEGWWLRSDIIWEKSNPMPESMTDRPTKGHEYIFLFAKSAQYHYDAAAIAEPASPQSHARAAKSHTGVGWGYATDEKPRTGGVNPKAQTPVSGWATGEGSHSAKDHARAKQTMDDSNKFGRGANRRERKQNESFSAVVTDTVSTRNIRTVWKIPTEPFPGAHFATFPQELVRRCILAGSRPGDTIFDPFHGSGTVGSVALDLGRNYIGCELNPEYVKMANSLRSTQIGMGI